MKNFIVMICSVLLISIPIRILKAQDIGKTWEFNEDGNSEGWTVYNSLADLDVSAGKLKANVTGTNAAFAGPAFNLAASDYGFILLRMRFTGSTPTARIRWKYSESTSIGRYDLNVAGDGEFHEYQIPVYTKSRWIGQITEFIDFTIKAEVGSIIEIDYLRIVSIGPKLDILSFKPFRTVLKCGHPIPVEAVVQNTGDKPCESATVSLKLPEVFDLVEGFQDFQLRTFEPQEIDTLRWTVVSNDTGSYEIDLSTTNPESQATLKTEITDKYWTVDKFYLSAYHLSKTAEAYDYYARANFNSAFESEIPPDKEVVDFVASYGLQCMLYTGTELDSVEFERMIQDFKNDTTVFGYYITDEPQEEAFENLAKIVAFLRKRDPERLFYINLIADVYSDYIEKFLDTVKPELLSYDYYHFLEDGDRPDYFKTIGAIRDYALKYDIPFNNIIQGCARIEKVLWRSPTPGEMRWLIYSSLAYGAKSIMYYSWGRNGGVLGVMESPNHDELYAAIAKLNLEITHLSPILLKLKSVAVYHSLTTPPGAIRLPANEIVRSVSDNADLVVGIFKNEDEQDYLILMNKDYNNSVTATITLNRAADNISAFNSDSARWQNADFNNTPDGAVFEWHFLAGGGTLFEIEDLTGVEELMPSVLPFQFKLKQNYPNPFNPTTNIEYELAEKEKVTLAIYDVLGREVDKLVNEVQEKGKYKINWIADQFSSGIYICQLKIGSHFLNRKMILLR